MNDIVPSIDKLFKDFKEEKLYKDYLKCKEKLNCNSEIISLINEIKRLQKIVVNNNDKVIEEKLKTLYKKLYEYPLYVTYIELKEEVENNLKLISKSFEKYFFDILKLEK